MQKQKVGKAPINGSIPDHLKTTVYQPNYITNSRYNYTLIQERIFTYVMFYLQHYTTRILRGEQINQLEIFQDNEPNIKIHVPLSYIVPDSPAQYNKVRKSAKELAGRVVYVPYKDKKGRQWAEYTGLMSVHVQEDGKQRTNHIIIGIKKSVAEMLINIEKRGDQPINYTTFLFENAMNAKHKYTPRIYKYLCSWREKQYAHPISVDDFKAMLGCEKAYTNYADFKKTVLVPVNKELKEKCDCWFDMDYENFEQKTNGKVSTLSFKVLTQETKLTERKLWDNNWNLLRTHFRLSQEQILQLERDFKQHTDPRQVLYKIMDLNERLIDNEAIRDHKAYVMRVLLKEFA